MKSNNEVTLRINGDLETFVNDLKVKGYKETEHFILDDIYMIPENLNMDEMSTRDIISKAIIIRKVNDIKYNEIRRNITHKVKVFNDKGEILEQQNIKVKIYDCKSALDFMNAIGYKKIMNIIEEDYEYEKDGFHLTTKDVKNGEKMIEAETNNEFDTIEKLKQKLIEENMLLDFSNYFVKKAEVELNKLLGRNIE